MGARPLGAAASLRALPARIAQDREGNAILEFAILAPVFLLLLLGTFDIGQMVYGRAVLHGAVEEAARSSSLETANTQVADEKVENALAPILPNASVESSRLSYFDFTDIGRPEAWNDANDDGTCNDGETFTDENRNGAWDADVGSDGNGGAGDVVLYTVTVTYTPTFNVPFLHNHDGSRSFSATAVKKNQPFADQDDYGSDAGSCA
ncbi:MAG: pilus assembly protein [Novosphingobium sp.]|nr:pilus assembly protein [Novosphingobium sp.]MCP5403492.1 pilus assembly protein [Novosphingobium sp.]